MSGAKGRSGGARPGSGPKPKPKVPLVVDPAHDSLAFLLSVQNDPAAEPALRVRAAIAAVQYQHPKMGEGGKKHGEKAGVERASKGHYAAASAPLRLVNGK